MKLKHILIALPFILITACSNTNSKEKGDFEVSGKIENANSENIYLDFISNSGIVPLDTAQLDDKGEFSFTPTIEKVGFYRIRLTDENSVTLIFDKGQNVSLTADAKNLARTTKIKGSPDSELFIKVSNISTQNYNQRDSLQREYQSYARLHQNDTALVNAKGRELDLPFQKLIANHNNYIQKFVEENSTSLAALAAVQQLALEDYMQTYLKLDKDLYAKYPDHDYVIAFHEDIKMKTACAIGTPSPEIDYNSPDGIPILLSSLKGKYVLIDFWASWCRPCRMENPNLVRAYNNYKDKGFDIYSVSLDNNMERWKSAIAQDNLTWKSHVCDFKGWQSPVVREFNFNGIPSNLLIDKNGIIIAKNLRGAALEQKLAEILD